jgi:hypothetical protein
MTIVLTEFITQSLSPALAISASGMLALGMHNRLSILGGRVRQINKDLRDESSPIRQDNLNQQIQLFVKRARILRDALFFLYAAICLMVITAVALAFESLHWINTSLVAMISFLLGLGLIFWAVLLEAWEVLLILQTLEVDIQGNHL